jgi:Na+-transporting NADH:ubiquinone oxidoreductase subunit NqrF
MTKDEFIIAYAEASGILVSDLSKYGTVLPCACGDEGCCGWTIVNDSPLSIKTHERLYAPEAPKP